MGETKDLPGEVLSALEAFSILERIDVGETTLYRALEAR